MPRPFSAIVHCLADMTHVPLLRIAKNISLLALVLPSLVAPSVAWAQDEEARTKQFEEALAAAQAGRWEEAQVVYEKLWNERRSYDVALLLGQAEYNLKRFRVAAEHLTYGLKLLPTTAPPQVGERSRQILGLCRKELGALDLQIRNKGAEVLVDGVVVAEVPLLSEVFVDPGEHRFDVRLAGHVPQSFKMAFVPGQTKQRAVELKPIEVPPQKLETPRPAGPPQTATPAQPAASASWTPVIIGGIVTVVGLSAGLGFEFARQASDDKAKSIRDTLPSDTENPCWKAKQPLATQCSRLVDELTTYDRFGRIELASFIVSGAALVGTGAYFFLMRPDQTNPGATAGQFGPFRLDAGYARRTGYIGLSTSF